MVDFSNLNKMCSWERQKAMYLIEVAEKLDMAVDGYGELAVNPNSGYTYLWLEDYPFTLYMPIDCELKLDDVMVLWSSPEDGEEFETELETKSQDDLFKWVKEREEEDAKRIQGEVKEDATNPM